MLRLLQALRRRRNVPEPSSTQHSESQKRGADLRITDGMAHKLFGKPEPEPVSQATPETSLPTGVPPRVKSQYVTYVAPEPPPRVDPFEEVRNAARDEPRFRALLEATKGKDRRELVKAIPELKSPHPYLSELEDEILRLVYAEGSAYAQIGRQHWMSAALVKRTAQEALSYVAFYLKHPERAGEHIPKCFNPAFQQFIMASTLEEKRFTAKRHPELKAMLDVLSEREALVLQALYWDDQTPAEIGERFGLSRNRIMQILNKALRKLKYHDRRQRERHEDQERRDEIVGALQQQPTLSEAARALELSPEKVLAYLERLELTPSVASPEREPGDDPRVAALKEAALPAARQRAATSYPELRPPHVFLNRNENRVLEFLYWQGKTYENTGKYLGWLSGIHIKGIEEGALEKLDYYLRHQPLSYYRDEPGNVF